MYSMPSSGTTSVIMQTALHHGSCRSTQFGSQLYICSLDKSTWLGFVQVLPAPHKVILYTVIFTKPVPVATPSMAWFCGRSPAMSLGSIPPEARMSVCCECCVLTGRGLCDGLITRPEESHRLCCVWVWSWSLDNVGAPARWGLLRHGGGANSFT